MKLKNFYPLLIFVSLLCSGCKESDEIALTEDYNFIKEKKAETVAPEVGVVTDCFPQKPGELGCSINTREGDPRFAESYNITITYEYETDEFLPFNRDNYSELILQYLDENNKLRVLTLLDNSDHLSPEKKNTEGGYHSAAISLKKKSGEPVYVAVFYSPYGSFYGNITFNIETEDGNFNFEQTSLLDYSIRQESFHITEQGVAYMIVAKLVYLP